MSDQPSRQSEADKLQKQPYGPGVLMVLGLFMLIIAAWCAYDLATQEAWVKEGRTGTILFNWGGLAVFSVAAVYLFILAAKRSKRGTPGEASAPPPADADRTDPAEPPAAAEPEAPEKKEEP